MINFVYVSEYLAYKLIGDTTTTKKTNRNKMLKIINIVVKLDL